MNWVPVVDYVDGIPFTRDTIKKKYYNQDTSEWTDITLYRIPNDRRKQRWLEKRYGAPSREPQAGTGWTVTFDKLVMNESIYLCLCLGYSDSIDND